MLRKILLTIVLSGCLLGVSSCDSEIWDHQMEVVVSEPGDVLDKVKEAYKAGKVVSAVAPNENFSGYVIDFSDGHRLTIKSEQPAKKFVVPHLKIDWEGNWCVTYDGGQSRERVCDGSGLPVTADAVAARFSVTDEGRYVVEGSRRDNSESVAYFETPCAVDQEIFVRSIVEDKVSETMTIEMVDGRVFEFDLDVVRPTAVTVQTKSINLGHNVEGVVEFMIKPSDAFIPLKMSGEGANVSLVVQDEGIAECVELTSIEPLTDEAGKEVEGHFMAHINDREIIAGYETKSVIAVVTGINGVDVDALESGPIEIARGRSAELEWLKVGGVGAVDDGDGTMMVKLPYGMNNMSALPVEYASGAMSVIAKGDDEEVKDCGQLDFSLPVTLVVASLTGETKEYKIVPYFSNLPVVYMTTPSAITSKDIWTADCEMQIWNAGENDGLYQKVNVKGRGNTTWSYPKKPYAIKLDKKTKVLGMPKHKRWCLLANWMDRTVMRNDVAFEIGRRLTGLDWTPRGEYVDVVFNGKMVGNYYLCEQIRVDENRVDIVEMESGDVSDETITGGYLVELDTYFDEVNKFRTKYRNLPVNIKAPDEDVLVAAQLDYIRGYFNNIEDILYGGVSGDVFDLIDIDSFVDWFFVYELVANGEPSHPKSSYMYKDRGGKLKAGPVWDFDWGTFMATTYWSNAGSIYYKELFKKPEFIAKVKERWNAAKPSLATIPEYIDTRYSEIKESAEANGRLWPIGGSVNGDESLSVADAVERLKNRYMFRFEWMDQQIGAM